VDAESGLEPEHQPNLEEFLLARIAEDKRIAMDAAEQPPLEGAAGEHVARHDPARVLRECSAKRRTVLACRDSGPDLSFLGARPPGMADFPLTPRNAHQLAALTLALLALPYADHPDYRTEWQP
jgi:hypothetical protein